ncbi:MAG TPA: hypothetical protein VFQ54_01345 [Thermomicrobiales bacterium]|nr:hypothetical protein [Thermomicrobiales bacterium]
MPILRRLVEQAMADERFRAVARGDLDEALRSNGYTLNDRERTLVFRFRDALNEAGIDVLLAHTGGQDLGSFLDDMDPGDLEALVRIAPKPGATPD